MDVTLETKCPNCGGELDQATLPGGAISLACEACHVAAIVSDDRFVDTKGLNREMIDARLEHRAKRVAENEAEAKGRFATIKLTDLSR